MLSAASDAVAGYKKRKRLSTPLAGRKMRCFGPFPVAARGSSDTGTLLLPNGEVVLQECSLRALRRGGADRVIVTEDTFLGSASVHGPRF